MTSSDKQNHDISYTNCSTISFDQSKMILYPHYTRSGYCNSEPIDTDKENEKKCCNVGNCVDSYCDKTIGFPPGVPQYKTFIHTDIQSASFTPSKEFTQSQIFSSSLDFPASRFFQSKSDSGMDKGIYAIEKFFKYFDM